MYKIVIVNLEFIQPFHIKRKVAYLEQWHLNLFENSTFMTSQTYYSVPPTFQNNVHISRSLSSISLRSF